MTCVKAKLLYTTGEYAEAEEVLVGAMKKLPKERQLLVVGRDFATVTAAFPMENIDSGSKRVFNRS